MTAVPTPVADELRLHTITANGPIHHTTVVPLNRTVEFEAAPDCA
jgi:hypothetical protein